jgi:hypothetical protein
MGGQACIVYGAAEFSRDIDLAVLATDNNLELLEAALAELQATPVFVPPLRKDVLLQGHASHFRAGIPEAKGIRIDIMSALHGCDPFEALWARRTQINVRGLGAVNLLALSDLVRAKKTQRDKDWPMVRRLIEADYHARRSKPSAAQVLFWLREARTPNILRDLSKSFPALAKRVAQERSVVGQAIKDQQALVERALHEEEEGYRARDKEYWRPLRAELAIWWRQQRRKRDS